MIRKQHLAIVWIAATVAMQVAASAGHPVTPWFPTTIRQAIADTDGSVVARRSPDKGDDELSATYEVVQVLIQNLGTPVSVGDHIKVELLVSEDSRLALLTATASGNQRSKVEWTHQFAVSELSLEYINQMAGLKNDDLRALCYCLGFIESNDRIISRDVQTELSHASLRNLQAAKRLMSRARLESLFLNENTPEKNAGVYGLMLGFCGDKDTERLLRKQILGTGRACRSERTLCGYLLLSGEAGLSTLKERYFLNETAEFAELYPALYALCMLFEDLPGHIEKQQVCQAIYPLLERKNLADVAIGRLAYLRDWTVQDRLSKMYDLVDQTPEQDLIRSAVIRYLKKSAADVPPDKTADIPLHAARAREFLLRIESSSPGSM